MKKFKSTNKLTINPVAKFVDNINTINKKMLNHISDAEASINDNMPKQVIDSHITLLKESIFDINFAINNIKRKNNLD